jgi:hypothetical protein
LDFFGVFGGFWNHLFCHKAQSKAGNHQEAGKEGIHDHIAKHSVVRLAQWQRVWTLAFGEFLRLTEPRSVLLIFWSFWRFLESPILRQTQSHTEIARGWDTLKRELQRQPSSDPYGFGGFLEFFGVFGMQKRFALEAQR